MDRYGFPGDVSFVGQNRLKAYYDGPAGQPAPAALGSVRPVLSGSGYRGAIGKQVNMHGFGSARQHDAGILRALGIRHMAGPRHDGNAVRMASLAGVNLGDLSRADCNTLMTTAGSLSTLASAATRAGVPAPPSRTAGESTAAFEARLRTYRQRYQGQLDAALALTTGGQALSTMASRSILIDEASPAGVPSSTSPEPSAWEIAAAQAALNANTSRAVSPTTIALGVGAVAVVGAVAYLLLK